MFMAALTVGSTQNNAPPNAIIVEENKQLRLPLPTYEKVTLIRSRALS